MIDRSSEIPVRLFLDYLQEKIDYHKGRMLDDGDPNHWWLETGAFKVVQDIFTDVITGNWAIKKVEPPHEEGSGLT